MIRANDRCLEQVLTLLDALDDAQYADLQRRGEALSELSVPHGAEVLAEQ